MKASSRAKRIKAEHPDIELFEDTRIEQCSGAKTPTAEIYGKYVEWRKSRGLPATVLSLCGFGRIFSKHFSNLIVFRQGKKVLRGVMGIRVK